MDATAVVYGVGAQQRIILIQLAAELVVELAVEQVHTAPIPCKKQGCPQQAVVYTVRIQDGGGGDEVEGCQWPHPLP